MCLLLALFRSGHWAGPGTLLLVASLLFGCSLQSQADRGSVDIGQSGGGPAAGSGGRAGSSNAGGAGGASCQDDRDARCSVDGGLEICKSGLWVREQDCGAGRCNASRRACLSCTPGTFKCKAGEGTLTQCSLEGSAWDVVRTCETSDACFADGDVGYCKACEAGSVSCEPARRDYSAFAVGGGDHTRASSALRACNADASGTEALDVCGAQSPVCDAVTARCRVCSPDSWSCDGSLLTRCNARGDALVVAEDCGHPALCDAPASTCKQAGCRSPRNTWVAPGTVSCEKSTLSTCRADGKWDVIDICSSDAACSAGIEPRVCLDSARFCTPGTSSCDGRTLQRCAPVAPADASGPPGGEYYAVATCAHGCSELPDNQAECEAASGSDNPFSDTQICEPGGTTLSTCSASGCVDATCPAGKVCANNALGCSACVPNAYRCDGSRLLRCDSKGSTEVALDDCGAGVCDAFRRACLPAAVGERYCEDGRFSTIDVDGNSLLIEDCGAAALCNPAFGCAPSACVLGSRSCDGSRVLECEDGTAFVRSSERCESAERCEEGLGCAKATRIAAGDGHTCAFVVAADARADATGYVKCWGANESGQLGNGAPELADEPEPRPVLARLDGQLVAAPIFRGTGLCAGRGFTCADVVMNGENAVACWGRNERGQLGVGASSRPGYSDADPQNHVAGVVKAPGASNNSGGATISGLHAVTCGADFACALDADRRPFCWGANDVGQLGVGQVGSLPGSGALAVRELVGVRALVAGGRHACAIDGSDVVHCWGDNGKSQLGQSGSAANVVAAPATVLKLTASLLALGRDFSLALNSDGLRGWGQNAFGQLGTGTTTASSEPTPSSGVKGARPTLLASGPTATHACALLDGSLACWGANPLGALGDDTMLDRYQAALTAWPSRVELSAQPGSVALGKAHTCALDASGGIWCWGASQRRQLGRDVPPGSALTPVRIY